MSEVAVMELAKCQTCGTRQRLDAMDVPEPLTGWIIYDGHTIGGTQHKATLCPPCVVKMRNGRPDPELKGWDAHCDTCDERASEEREDGDPPLTEKDADQWSRRHQCEPSTSIKNLDASSPTGDETT